MSDLLIDLQGIRKVFRSPFLQRPKVALHGLDLQVRAGEIFGFLGPNGAGKTTAIKVLLGLIRPTQGAGTLLGQPFGSVDARRDLGFLPDAPNFYRYLTARELLTFAGELHRLESATLKDRVAAVLHRVHLDEESWDRQLRTYSRGMLQRVGIAVAILHQPRLVVLDEPMNGLDPQGRSEFRDLIRSLRGEGATVFLSTHVLADIEATADRVAILNQGELLQCGSLDDFLSNDGRVVELGFSANMQTSGLDRCFRNLRPGATGWIGEVDRTEAEAVVRKILDEGGNLLTFAPRRVSLEEYFLQMTASEVRRPHRSAVDAPERSSGRSRESGDRTERPAVSEKGESR
ncbi:MAG: ABC transporter ATP-binding protein [Gemmatimonadota bacterium]|nr:MAG: ABC transporter ATP-binding protein [Gemmatimonadota bacterium]